MKHYKKIHKVGNNVYSLLSFDRDLYVGTESFIELPNRFGFKRKINQGFKVLELTPPILYLFNAVLDCKLIEEDKDFPDMNKYELVNSKDLRKTIKDVYDAEFYGQIDNMLNDFNEWVIKINHDNENKLSKEELDKIVEKTKEEVDRAISYLKINKKEQGLSFKVPRITDSKDLYNFTQLERLNFLYSNKVGSNLRFNYFYDLDEFGNIIIYKVQTVKGYVKTIDTFIYNRDIINKIVVYIVDHNL